MIDEKLVKRTVKMTSDNRKNILDFLIEVDSNIYKDNLKLFQKVKVLDLLFLGSLRAEAEELFYEIMSDLESRIKEIREDNINENEIVELEYLMIILIRAHNATYNFEKYGESVLIKSENHALRDIRKLKEHYEMLGITTEQQIKKCVNLAKRIKNEELKNKLDDFLKLVELKMMPEEWETYSQELARIVNEFNKVEYMTKTEKRALQNLSYELAAYDLRLNE